MPAEVEMVRRDRWQEIHRRAGAGGSIRAIARELDLDRKTVRRCLRQSEWKPYQRPVLGQPTARLPNRRSLRDPATSGAIGKAVRNPR